MKKQPAGTGMVPSHTELGNLIRSRRKELGMTLERLAKKLDVSRQFINAIEFGKSNLTTNSEMIAQLAEALEFDRNKLETVRPKRRLKMKNNSNSFGGFIYTKRLELHLTQRQLGEYAEVSSASICGLENGTRRTTPNMIKKLQKALGQIPPELIPAARRSDQ